METHSNTSSKHLSKILEDLSTAEKIKLFDLLSDELLDFEDLPLRTLQRKALDRATEKELQEKSIFHSWQETKNFVRSSNE